MKRELRQYLDECHKATVRYADKTKILLSQTRAGEEKARRELISGNRELAALLALHLRPETMLPEDAVQEGVLALERLIDDADDNFQVHLASAIQRALESSDSSAQAPPRRKKVNVRPRLRRLEP